MDEFEFPEDIAALSDADLATAIEKAEKVGASFDDIPDADLTDEQVQSIVALSEFVISARESQASRAAAAEERAGRAAEARRTLKASEPEPEKDEDKAEETDKAEEKEPEAVAAAARPRSVVARAAAAVPAPVLPKTRQGATLLASADIPGIVSGSPLTDLNGVGEAAVAKMRTFPTGRVGGAEGTQIRGSIARIEKAEGRAPKVRAEDYNDHLAALAAAGNESRLPGNSLVAAGGWCAPSETLYDLCALESTDGILDLPELQVSRGGIRFMQKPDFAQIYQDVGFHLTEAEVISGTAKTCIEVDCPTWDEIRLDAIGLCIKAGILTNSAFPEYVRYFIEAALIAHQHKISAGLITDMLADSQAINAGAPVVASDSLGELDVVANYVRESTRMARNTSLELVAPNWYKSILRADLARRGDRDLLSVSDAEIDGLFRDRNIAPQWVYNMDDLTATGVPPAAQTVVIPESTEVLLYPAGTWVKGTTDVINLDAIYDSTNILTNTYTALFAEEGIALIKRCNESYKVTLGTCASGQTGAKDLADCYLGGAPVVP
jgi:hypothetical protein